MIAKTDTPSSEADRPQEVPEIVVQASSGSLSMQKHPRLARTAAEPESLQYDAEEITAHYQRRPLQVLRRIVKVLTPTIAFVFGFWWDLSFLSF